MTQTAIAPIRGRFAPSPTGALHAGSLVAALASYLMAKSQHGQWLIRIEDLDPPREIAGMAARQLAVLAEFGLLSDEPVLYQSQRTEHYQQALQALLNNHAAFHCACSRTQLADSGGIHRICLTPGKAGQAAIRLRVNKQAMVFEDGVYGRQSQNLYEAVGDVVLKRADGLFAYQLAVVVDDHLQGINQIVRGADLLDSTPRQMFLQQQLGLPTPDYWHIPLVLGSDGQKLSKSQWAADLNNQDRFDALCAAYGHLGQNTAVLSRMQSATENLAQAVRYFEPAALRTNAVRVPT